MKIIITGGSGFIGKHLTTLLLEKGYEVVILDIVSPSFAKEQNLSIVFHNIDLTREKIPREILTGVHAIVHLAGRSIFCRWSEQIKKEIYDSRVKSVENLVDSCKQLSQKPEVLISASAAGYYGSRGEDDLDESSSAGSDFLSKLCADWEVQTRKADSLGIRTVQIRTAPVLGDGGLLDQMLPIFKLGLGGSIAGGKQWFPWIHIKDIIHIYLFALENRQFQGAVNACSPQLVRQREFAQTLAKVVKRPAFLSTPKWALRLRFGELADALTASQKVRPTKLLYADYQFRFPDLNDALINLLETRD
ncbi:TIGR01777 family protein [Patescibacteria group bacterium]|nr:TIGR01777 family protein [Patescibacteria group bacterium]